jgi:predicted transcriptional regulator
MAERGEVMSADQPLSEKQLEIMQAILKGGPNQDGTPGPADMDQILDGLSYVTSKESIQFSIRSLIGRGLIGKLPQRVRRGRLRVCYGLTESGEAFLTGKPDPGLEGLQGPSVVLISPEGKHIVQTSAVGNGNRYAKRFAERASTSGHPKTLMPRENPANSGLDGSQGVLGLSVHPLRAEAGKGKAENGGLKDSREAYPTSGDELLSELLASFG